MLSRARRVRALALFFCFFVAVAGFVPVSRIAPASVAQAQERTAVPFDPRIGEDNFFVGVGKNLYDTGIAAASVVTFNSQANEYLVIWIGYSLGGNQEVELYGRRLSADGVVQGRDIRISHTPGDDAEPNDPFYAAVAYNSTANEYLVVWSAAITATRIFGQRLSADGAEIGADDFGISQRPLDAPVPFDAYNPAVSYNSALNEYLVVWTGGDVFNGDQEIYGQRLTAQGSKIGTHDFRISQTGPDGVPYGSYAPDVSYNTTLNEYLVVWHGEMSSLEFEILGQRLTAFGAAIGTDDFSISQMVGNEDALNPATSYNPSRNEYLVVWESRFSANGMDKVYSQRLTADGIELGTNDFVVSQSKSNGFSIVPDVVYNTLVNEYFVVWRAYGPLSDLGDEEEIFGQRLSPSGGLQGNAARISEVGPVGESRYRVGVPAVAYAPQSNEYLTVWIGEFIFFGQRLTFPPWLAVLYLAGDDRPPGDERPNAAYLSAKVAELVRRLRQMPRNPAVALAVLVDLGGNGDAHIYVQHDGTLVDVTEQVIGSPSWEPNAQVGGVPGQRELDTGDQRTLRGFLRWARAEYYPGANYSLLSIVDHGGGWAPDFGNPGQPASSKGYQDGGWRGMSIDFGTNTSLSTHDTGLIFEGDQPGAERLPPVDLLFYDACLMGMLETAYEVRDHASFLIAGENQLWAMLPYQHYLSPSVISSNTRPAQLARRLVAQYNNVTDAESYTLTAINQSQIGTLTRSVDALAGAMLAQLAASPAFSTTIRAAYQRAQKFDYDSSESIDQQTDGYVDLQDFARILRDDFVTTTLQAVRDAASLVYDGVTAAVLEHKIVPGSPIGSQEQWLFAGANGLSIYLPLGEKDIRPTGPEDENGNPAEELQLDYYANPLVLDFSGPNGAPQWAALLRALEPNTPPRDAGRQGFRSPAQLFSARVFLPLVLKPQ